MRIDPTAGTYREQARTKALRLAAIRSSLSPVRQKFLATTQVPGQASVLSRSCGRTDQAL
jgi:hypothetical protein